MSEQLEDSREQKLKEQKEKLLKFLEENMGKFSMVDYRDGRSSGSVKLHEMHREHIKSGWIVGLKLHSEQEGNNIKRTIFLAKMELIKKSGRKYKL